MIWQIYIVIGFMIGWFGRGLGQILIVKLSNYYTKNSK